MTDSDMLLNLTARLDALDARLDRIEAQPAVQKPALTTLPVPVTKPATPTGNPGAAPFPMYWDNPAPPIAPMLADLFGTLRRLLPCTNADGSQLSDADILARAIDKITTLQAEADLAAWRSVDEEPPPQRADVLFYSGGCFWVGYAQEVVVRDSETGTEFTELNYFCDDDLMDGDPPTAWCPIPTTGEHDPDE